MAKTMKYELHEKEIELKSVQIDYWKMKAKLLQAEFFKVINGFKDGDTVPLPPLLSWETESCSVIGDMLQYNRDACDAAVEVEATTAGVSTTRDGALRTVFDVIEYMVESGEYANIKMIVANDSFILRYDDSNGDVQERIFKWEK